jgi:hypothetical protein
MNPSSFADLIKNITAVLAVMGIPVAFFQIRKTLAEIRKIELETKALEKQGEYKKSISTSQTDVPSMSYRAITDPRLIALSLLLSDLIVTGFILIVTNYALDIFLVGPLRPLILSVLSIMLLSPIAWEAWRLRRGVKNGQKGGAEKQIKTEIEMKEIIPVSRFSKGEYYG